MLGRALVRLLRRIPTAPGNTPAGAGWAEDDKAPAPSLFQPLRSRASKLEASSPRAGSARARHFPQSLRSPYATIGRHGGKPMTILRATRREFAAPLGGAAACRRRCAEFADGLAHLPV